MVSRKWAQNKNIKVLIEESDIHKGLSKVNITRKRETICSAIWKLATALKIVAPQRSKKIRKAALLINLFILIYT